MLQSAPLLKKPADALGGLLSNAPRIGASGNAVMSPRSDRVMQNAPFLQGQIPPKLPETSFPERTGPFDMQPRAGGLPDLQPKKRSKRDIGKLLSDFIINYGAASGHPLARSVLSRRAAEEAQQRLWGREDEHRLQDRQWNIEDAQREASQPKDFMSGKDRVRFDPVTGQATILYDAPESHEAYAASLGLEPGTEEYTRAMQDYVLRSSGPTAYGYDVDLDNIRTQNDIRRKSAPTYRQANPLPRRSGRSRSGVKMKPGERSITTADGRVQVVRGGKWVDAQ